MRFLRTRILAGTMIAQCRYAQPRRSPRDGQRASEDVSLLRHVDLRLIFNDLFDLLARGRLMRLFVPHDRADRLRLERRLTRISHEVHANRIACFRIDVRQHAGLEDNRTASGDDVL